MKFFILKRILDRKLLFNFLEHYIHKRMPLNNRNLKQFRNIYITKSDSFNFQKGLYLLLRHQQSILIGLYAYRLIGL